MSHKRRRCGIKAGLEIVGTCIIGCIAALLVLIDPGEHLQVFESKTVDARQRFFAAPSRHTNDIIILDISEDAIKRLEPIYGRWPWPRSLHGEVVRFLSEEGVRSVGFDLIFSEKTVRQEIDAAQIESFRALASNADLPEVKQELSRQLDLLRPGMHDDLFVEAVRHSGRVFQASVVYGSGGSGDQRPSGATLRQLVKRASASRSGSRPGAVARKARALR